MVLCLLFEGILHAQPTCTEYLPYDMSGAIPWGDGTPGSCTRASLQALISNGGKIICNCGDEPFTLVLDTTLMVPGYKEVIIDGQGKTSISGKNTYRIFDKQTASNQNTGRVFALQNIQLKEGFQSRSMPGLGGSAIRGQAIGSLFLYNVNIEDNHGPATGSDSCGAIHTIVYKEAKFINCTFKNNTAANGGAVGCIGTPSVFVNCRFDNNKALGTTGDKKTGGNGGAVYADGVDQSNQLNPSMNFCGCTFVNNYAGYQGGALNIVLHTQTNSSLYINQCVFENNSCANDKGGAVYYMYWSSDTSKKSNNMPLTGSIKNTVFFNNSAHSMGGAVWMHNANTLFENVTFYKNKAFYSRNDTFFGLGGAIAHSGGYDKDLFLVNCSFVENHAGNFASGINAPKIILRNSFFYNHYTGDGYQFNPYAGAVINKNAVITLQGGNLQYPKTFKKGANYITDYWITSEVLTADPLLHRFADYGGNTYTMAVLPGSPLIHAGTAVNAPAYDQRGKQRDAQPDIGAYEFMGNPTLNTAPTSLQFDSIEKGKCRIISYTIAGANLLDTISMHVQNPFTLAVDSTGNFSSSLILPLHGDAMNQKIFVKACPPETGSFSKQIVHQTAFLESLSVSVKATAYLPNHPPDSIWIECDSILENRPVGTFITKIHASDPDIGDNLNFSLCNDESKLVTTLRNDSLFAKQSFHYNSHPLIEVCIAAGDNRGGSIQKVFSMQVIPNDTSNHTHLPDSNVVIADKSLTIPTLNVYPNPCKEWLNFTSNIPIEKIDIYNLQGVLHYEIKPFANHCLIKQHNLPSGVYIGVIRFNNTIVRGKIVVQ